MIDRQLPSKLYDPALILEAIHTNTVPCSITMEADSKTELIRVCFCEPQDLETSLAQCVTQFMEALDWLVIKKDVRLHASPLQHLLCVARAAAVHFFAQPGMVGQRAHKARPA